MLVALKNIIMNSKGKTLYIHLKWTCKVKDQQNTSGLSQFIIDMCYEKNIKKVKVTSQYLSYVYKETIFVICIILSYSIFPMRHISVYIIVHVYYVLIETHQ